MGPEQVEAAVVEMAEEYRRQYSSDPGGKAIEFIEDESGAVAPELKAGSLAYSRMYPDEFKDAQAERDLQSCTLFAEKYGSGAVNRAYQVLNNIEIDEATYKTEYEVALRWRSFNSD